MKTWIIHLYNYQLLSEIIQICEDFTSMFVHTKIIKKKSSSFVYNIKIIMWKSVFQDSDKNITMNVLSRKIKNKNTVRFTWKIMVTINQFIDLDTYLLDDIRIFHNKLWVLESCPHHFFLLHFNNILLIWS